MLKTLKAMVLSSVLLAASAAFAQEAQPFYAKDASEWKAIGFPGNEKLNPLCAVTIGYNKGATFTLIKDLKDGELYLQLNDPDWKIALQPGIYKDGLLVLNTDQGNVEATVPYTVDSGINIRIRHINDAKFITSLMTSKLFEFSVPTQHIIADVPLGNVIAGMKMEADCVLAFGSHGPIGLDPKGPWPEGQALA